MLQGLALLTRQSFVQAEQYRDAMLSILEIDPETIDRSEEVISDIMWNGDTIKNALKYMKIEVDTSYSTNASKKK